MIFNSGRLLDAEQGSEQSSTVPALLDQPAGDGPDLTEYKWQMQQLIRRFEPRVESVEVESVDYQGAGSGKCSLKLRIHDVELVQNFQF